MWLAARYPTQSWKKWERAAQQSQTDGGPLSSPNKANHESISEYTSIVWEHLHYKHSEYRSTVVPEISSFSAERECGAVKITKWSCRAAPLSDLYNKQSTVVALCQCPCFKRSFAGSLFRFPTPSRFCFQFCRLVTKITEKRQGFIF